MTDTPNLDAAFQTAIEAVTACRAAGMTCVDGSSAAASLDRLQRELTEEREKSLERGYFDKEWFQKTVRWLVEWVPQTELTLIAALGGIARAKPSTTA